jgi:hypothetical protein
LLGLYYGGWLDLAGGSLNRGRIVCDLKCGGHGGGLKNLLRRKLLKGFLVAFLEVEVASRPIQETRELSFSTFRIS